MANRNIPVKYLDEWTEQWRLTDAAYNTLLKRWDLNLNAYFLLRLLRDNPDGVEPAVIADKISVLRQTVTVLLNELEKRDYILRQASKLDHRRKKIVLTGSGRRFADQLCGEIMEIEREALSVFTPEEQETLFRTSRIFYRSFKAAVEKHL